MLRLQKRLAQQVTGAGKTRVKFNPDAVSDIKESITKADIKTLVDEGDIKVIPKKGVSRHRARARHAQKKRGRQRGYAKRTGTKKARNPAKRAWINKIRPLRRTLKEQKSHLKEGTYRELYRKAKGNFFRNTRHLLLYIEQHSLKKGGRK